MASVWISRRSSLIRSFSLATNSFQPRPERLEMRRIQLRVELGALVFLQEVVAGDAVGLGEAEEPALVADQALVDVVELLDQAIDARLVEAERLDRGDDLVLELLVAALLARARASCS